MVVQDQEKLIILLNLIKHQQQNIDKIYLYIKDSLELMYQLLVNGREKVETGNLKILKASVGYSQKNDNVYEILKNYNPIKKMRVLVVLDDMIVDMDSNKKLSSIVIELFLRERKLTVSLVFTS